MKLITLIGFVVLVVLAATASGQRHASYYDYDYQDATPARQPNPPQTSYVRVAAPAPAPRHTAQAQPRPTPVPILKQINRHNDDGSYTYGYEGADGSFKIETKLPTGEVMGKYGYVDDRGKLRVIDYGANRYGFQPAGEGITVAPPTLVDETTGKDGGKTFADYDDEPAYVVQPKPARSQKRPEVFVARPPQSVPRSYTGLDQDLRPAPTPVYQDVPLEFTAAQTPAPTSVRFAPASRRQSPTRFVPPVQAAPVSYSQAPVPQRANIPNAVPVSSVFTPAANPSSRPAPVRESHSGAVSGSLLDQLVKQYALPSGVGQPLHDITFGSYSSQTNF